MTSNSSIVENDVKNTSDLISQREIRLQKAKKLRDIGIDPYPASVKRTAKNKEIVDNFDNLEGKSHFVVGRVMSIRRHGKLVFMDIQDDSGKIQLYIKRDEIEPYSSQGQNLGWDYLDLIDIGDFVEAYGEVTKTKRGEISILVKKVRVISKAIRPLPDKWHGISDKEVRFRRRYLDMTMRPEIRERFKRRSLFWKSVREFLDSHGFYEINIPVLELIPGGADAKPFVTYYDALDQNFFLRISHELPLKMLLGGGFEKVYDIGPRFRNEGFSDEHLPEHIAMEWYWAYADYKEGMRFTEEMIQYVVKKVYGKLKFKIRGFDVDFSGHWPVVKFVDVIKEKFGLDVLTDSVEKMYKIYLDNGGEPLKDVNRSRVADHLWKLIRKDIAGPIFLVEEPKFLSPLAKADPNDNRLTLRFHVVAAGSEIINAFSELNDPVDQLNRFMEQQKLREAGDEEAQFLDIDFVEMLEWGMPPAVGLGFSERLFWFLEDVTAKEGVPFPQLRYEVDLTTKKIYPDIDFDKIRESAKSANK